MDVASILFVVGGACWPLGFIIGVALVESVARDGRRLTPAIISRVGFAVGSVYALGFALIGLGWVIMRLT